MRSVIDAGGFVARPPKRTIQFLWERILPSHGIHLLCGPTGAGKGTLLHQFIDALEHGQDFLGYQTFGADIPWCYIGADRDIEAIWDTIDRVGVTPNEANVYSWEQFNWPQDIAGLTAAMHKLLPKGGLFIIDGIHDFVEDANKAHPVALFMRTLRKVARRLNIIVLAIGFSPKARPGEEYKSPRNRVMGTVAWPHHADTCLIIEQTKEVGPERRLYICPRNSEDFMMRLVMDGGKLIEPSMVVAETAFDFQLDKLANDAQFPTSDVLQWADDANVSRRTAFYWLQKSESAGRIQKVGHGLWKKLLIV
jgi:energy-coupling factor transporter ATP-binding protein EcfA2